MTARRYRIASLFLAVAVAALVLGGIVLVQAVVTSLRAVDVPADALRIVRRDLVGTLLALGVILLGITIVAGNALARALRDTRAALLARARGDAAELPGFTVRELDELTSAAERLFARVSARETELERNHHDVSVLLDAISEGIVQLDANGRVVRANPAARALLNLDRDSSAPVAAQVRQVELRRIFERAAAGGGPESVEITHADRRVLVSARPIRDAERGAVVSFIDLTEVRRLEGVRRDFVANVSHELKTPLTSIRGYVETLLGDDGLDIDTRRRFLDVVHKNADRLHRIVDDLLDLSRLESGGWRPEPQRVNVLDMIDDAWSSCSDAAGRRRIAFQPPAHGATVTADPGALRQVLSNLLENALRYTADGGRIEVAVNAPHVSDDERNPLVTVEVRDNGAGIPSDALPRIFERFYRADPARSRAQGGTGLGLSIVKHLVESMGGDVSAESELGKGTVVRFRLPRAA
ncbi:MAG TPA: ATP-binding protein [Longimicrobiales bacterium]|nr:ATP-binding protein [Longimicrobiales bacterium]